jgi:hypothetical protein
MIGHNTFCYDAIIAPKEMRTSSWTEALYYSRGLKSNHNVKPNDNNYRQCWTIWQQSEVVGEDFFTVLFMVLYIVSKYILLGSYITFVITDL